MNLRQNIITERLFFNQLFPFFNTFLSSFTNTQICIHKPFKTILTENKLVKAEIQASIREDGRTEVTDEYEETFYG